MNYKNSIRMLLNKSNFVIIVLLLMCIFLSVQFLNSIDTKKALLASMNENNDLVEKKMNLDRTILDQQVDIDRLKDELTTESEKLISLQNAVITEHFPDEIYFSQKRICGEWLYEEVIKLPLEEQQEYMESKEYIVQQECHKNVEDSFLQEYILEFAN